MTGGEGGLWLPPGPEEMRSRVQHSHHVPLTHPSITWEQRPMPVLAVLEQLPVGTCNSMSQMSQEVSTDLISSHQNVQLHSL
jgi:hypothetical protein